MQRFPTRANMKRARYGLNPDLKAGNIVDAFADTRSDLVKRMKIRQVLDFIDLNREAYHKYLSLPESTGASTFKPKQTMSSFRPSIESPMMLESDIKQTLELSQSLRKSNMKSESTIPYIENFTFSTKPVKLYNQTGKET